MAGLNKVQVIGNLGKDPETKFNASGKAVCKFSVAVNEEWTQNGEKKSHCEWFNVTVFDKQAEACGQYLAKGRQVYVEGRQRTSEYEKNGEKKFWTEVIADRVQFLGSKPDSDSTSSPAQGVGGIAREQTDFP